MFTDLAFDAFESMRTSGDVEMGLDVYNRLIHACGSRPDGLRRALGLFEEIKADESMEPDAYTYGSLLVSLYLMLVTRAISLTDGVFFYSYREPAPLLRMRLWRTRRCLRC